MTNHDHPEEDDGFWIRTEPSIDGTAFIVTMSIGSDYSVRLTPVRANQYASALLAAAADAEYDAAIFKQMTEKLKVADDVAGQMVLDMRSERPERAAAGLTFTGGVSLFHNRRPFIAIARDGKTMGQFEPPAARRHALHVLEAVPTADLDATYLKVLSSTVGIDKDKARQVVEDIGNFRPEWTVSDE